MSAHRARWLFAAAAVAVALISGAAIAAPPVPAASDAHRAVPGVPEGGPPVLYAPPPNVPELQNRDPRFRAPYEGVSGSERYVDGEYLYTDFLYDETGSYPSDFARYGNNAADLMEYRMSVRGGDLAVRLSLTTLLAADSTIAVVAFDTDRNASTGSSTLPRDPGMPFPGTDAVLTTWGTGAEWSTWNGSAWRTVKLASKADLQANQITVTVPEAVARPSGRWSTTVATGLYDPSTGGWLDPGVGASKIFNLAFRFDANKASGAPSGGQSTALTAGTPTTYAHELDFDLLRSGGQRANIPQTGFVYRMFASRLASVPYALEVTPGNYQQFRASEGRQPAAFLNSNLSRLQPYTLYVPTHYTPEHPAPLTVLMHGQDGEYHWINGTPLTKLVGEDRGSIVLSPSGRGPRGWYRDESEYDVYEAWNDAARHYALDPQRTALTGVSMGGYGSYRIGLRYPQLFSRIAVLVPAVQGGLLPNGGRNVEWVPGVNEDDSLINRWVENARNLPIFHVSDMLSESVFPPAQLAHVVGPSLNGRQSLDSLGYRYKFWGVVQDHALAIILENYPEWTPFLGQNTIEPDPFHVSMARVPATDRRDLGLTPDAAYWVSDVVLRDAVTPQPAAVPGGPTDLPTGHVDAVSLGFGKTDAPSTVAHGAGTTGDGLPYVEQERTWGKPGPRPVENRIVIKAKNVRSLTIDPVAARVDCNVKLDITSDGPLDVRLLGCPKSVAASTPAGGGSAATAADALPATGSSAPLLGLPLIGGGILLSRARGRA